MGAVAMAELTTAGGNGAAKAVREVVIRGPS